MRIWEFENAVWALDGVRIVIRGDANDEVDDYGFERAAPGHFTLQNFIDQRIRPRVGDKEVMAINGGGEVVRGNTQLRNIKETYNAE